MKENLKRITIICLIGGFLLGLFISVVEEDTKRNNAPCEDFGGYRVENVPARCYHHFHL